MIAVRMMVNEVKQKETELVMQGQSHSVANTAGTYNFFSSLSQHPLCIMEFRILMDVSSHECKKNLKLGRHGIENGILQGKGNRLNF